MKKHTDKKRDDEWKEIEKGVGFLAWIGVIFAVIVLISK